MGDFYIAPMGKPQGPLPTAVRYIWEWKFLLHIPGLALLWVPTLGGAPARASGGCVFEERVGLGGRNAPGWVN